MTRRQNDGWGGFRGYMSVKVQKLEQQFDDDHEKNSQNTTIFAGIAIHVNGHTDPEAHKLKELMQKHGGRYVHYYTKNKVTHIIAQNLPVSKQRQLRDEKVVAPQWVVDSVEAGTLLPWTKYQLYAIRERNQKGLDAFLKDKATSSRPVAENDWSVDLDDDGQCMKEVGDEGRRLEDVEEEEGEVGDGRRDGDNKRDQEEEVVEIDDEPRDERKFSKTSSNRTKRAGEEGFLSDFYARSRLHHLSSWGAEFKEYVNRLRSDSRELFPLRERLRGRSAREDSAVMERIEQGSGRVVMHVDMDCFFVSVGLRSRPELRGKPVAVTHSKGAKPGDGSMSEIASCSYEARAAGVKNGMLLGRAKELCCGLLTIPYDFDNYKAVAQTLYDTVAKYTLEIEAVSCDELIVECTSLLRDVQCSPLTFAEDLRSEIENLTSCTASCGFGPNVLLSRVATRKAKPDGAFWITDEQVLGVMEEFPVRNLPGVGPSIARRLSALSCETCGELQNLALSTLQKEFGSKTGHSLYQLCRGVDNTPVKSRHERKSISAEVNYGIRFRNREEFDTFLSELANELSVRMKRCVVKGRSITLKLMIRRPDQPQETRKFMGHGLCNNVAKSVTLPVPTDDSRLIGQEVAALAKQVSFLPEDVRGMGIQMHKLDTEGKEKNSMDILDFLKRNPAPQTALRNGEGSEFGNGLAVKDSRTSSGIFSILENRKSDRGSISKNFVPVEDLPNYSQLNSSFLDAMPEDIREELGEMLPSSSKPRVKEPSKRDVGRPKPFRSPAKRGRGRGRAKVVGGSRQQLTLTSMFGEKSKPPPTNIESHSVHEAADPESDEDISLFGAKTFEDIRLFLRDWVDAEPEPLEKDVGYFMTFLTNCLPRNLELLCQSLSFFRSLCVDDQWRSVYSRLENAVQSEMVLVYGGPLKSSAIDKFAHLPQI